MIDIGSTLVERYELRARLGRGGMGEVYRAWDHELERDVAIKSLLPHLAADPELVSRFRREARALARLRHHGIIALYDILRVPPNQLYLVLEYVPGEPLDRLMARTPMPWSRCVAIGAEVCDALQAAHAEGVVHRDIKPSNILVEAGDRARVADFGLARLAGGAARSGVSVTTRTGVVMGTPGYWAPEQALGRTITPQTDLYALGAVLFEAATGRLPHVAEDDSPAAAFIHIALPVPDPREIAPLLPDAAADVLMRALAKDPTERFESAAAMAAALRAAVGVRSSTRTASHPETEIASSAPVALLSDPAIPPPPDRITPAPTIGPGSPIPGPWSPPPGTLIAPEAEAETRPRALPAHMRADRRHQVAVVAGIIGLAAVGGVAGQMIGGGDSPPPPEGVRAVSTQGLSIDVPETWAVAVPATPSGLAFTGATAGATGPDGSGLIVGLLTAEKPTLLPKGITPNRSASPVRLSPRLAALSYTSLAAKGLSSKANLDLVVVSTDRGGAAVVCVATSTATCDAATTSLRIGAQNKVFGPGPDPEYGKLLRRVLTGLDIRRSTDRAKLAAAPSPAIQAEAARVLAQSYRGAAQSLRPVTLDVATTRANKGLVAALSAITGAYEQLGAASADGNALAFTRAKGAIIEAEKDLAAALKLFTALGYTHR